MGLHGPAHFAPPSHSPNPPVLSPSYTGTFPVSQPNQEYFLLIGGSNYHCPRVEIRKLRLREIHFTGPGAENSRAQGLALSGICPWVFHTCYPTWFPFCYRLFMDPCSPCINLIPFKVPEAAPPSATNIGLSFGQ